jgi:GNAT superfamily N-acetyltransferase
MSQEKIIIRKLHPTEIEPVAEIISLSMNKNEGKWAKATMEKHFDLKNSGLDDGRVYFAGLFHNKIIGIVGLHHYEWGPPQNVWLGWFAIHPDKQRQGLGSKLLSAAEEQALALGYSRLLVETYTSREFTSARSFYTKSGYIPAGIISDYIENGVDMIVYSKFLS